MPEQIQVWTIQDRDFAHLPVSINTGHMNIEKRGRLLASQAPLAMLVLARLRSLILAVLRPSLECEGHLG